MSNRILTRLALSVVLMSTVVLAACTNTSAANVPVNPAAPAASGNTGGPVAPKAPTGRIKATWITPVTEGNTVLLPVSELEKDVIVHFAFDAGQGKMPFMAYLLEGKTYVRANICPPCRSYNFSLEKGILICDTCATRFDAVTGEGISGACVNYPKAAVNWTTAGENIVANGADLGTAYENTLKPGQP